MGRVKTAASAVPSPMPRQPYRSTLELDDLAPLFQRPTLSLRWFEILRNIKLNQSRHSNLFRTEHQISFTQLVLSKREIRIAGRGDNFYEQRKRWLGQHTKKAHTQHMFQVLTIAVD